MKGKALRQHSFVHETPRIFILPTSYVHALSYKLKYCWWILTKYMYWFFYPYINKQSYCVVNIHWRNVQRKNVVNNVDMSSLRAPWQNDPYKNKQTEQHKTRRLIEFNKYNLLLLVQSSFKVFGSSLCSNLTYNIDFFVEWIFKFQQLLFTNRCCCKCKTCFKYTVISF